MFVSELQCVQWRQITYKQVTFFPIIVAEQVNVMGTIISVCLYCERLGAGGVQTLSLLNEYKQHSDWLHLLHFFPVNVTRQINVTGTIISVCLLRRFGCRRITDFKFVQWRQTTSRLVIFQCLRNYTGTSAFADVSYLMANVEAKFFV